jgi:hypothetical protein
MKIGIWHEKIVGKVQTDEKTFQDYATKYIKFIKDNNIQRAFFLLMDPGKKFGTYAKNGWIEKYWLNKLPTNCEAGLVMDTEPTSTWVGANTIFKNGDTMELAFQYVSNLNKTSNKKITCLGFDYENVAAYYSKQGENWIESLWKKYCPNITLDYGYNPKGPPPKPQGNYSYPEIYWVGELAPVGCKGKEGPKCKCPNTPYCKNNGDPTTLLNGKLGDYIENHKSWLSQPNVWPMFSVECLSQTNCVGSPYTKTNPCGVVDAFGTWTKDDFMKFLNTVESKYGITQAMMYEWNYIPTDWLTTPPPTLFNRIITSCKLLIKKYLSI